MNHGWSTYIPPTYPPQKSGFNKALLGLGKPIVNERLIRPYGGGVG